MTQGDCNRLTSQIEVLRQVVKDYQGKTIDNIIQQMEARAKEYKAASYKVLLTEHLENRLKQQYAGEYDYEKVVIKNLLYRMPHFSSNELILAKLNIMMDAHKKMKAYYLRAYDKPKNVDKYYYAEDKVARECLDYLQKEG